MTCSHKPYSETDLDDRRDVVASALESQRLEGLELDPETLEDFEAFKAGRIDLKDVRSKIEARFHSRKSSSAFFL